MNTIRHTIQIAGFNALACVLTLFVLTFSNGAFAEPQAQRVGLVLGGGGAKGIAHIGVLKYLEEQQIPVDFVVGTSMGAIAGGLFVQGVTPQELERLVLTVNWQHLFTDEAARKFSSIRRKEEDRGFPLLASMAIPGIFAPVYLNDRYLVDGGMANNLPIDLAMQMGATHLIVVDLSEQHPTVDELNGPLAMMEQAANLMIRNNTHRQLAQLRPQDIHLTPELLNADVAAVNFDKAFEAIDIGYQAAKNHAAALQQFRVDNQTWLAS